MMSHLSANLDEVRIDVEDSTQDSVDVLALDQPVHVGMIVGSSGGRQTQFRPCP